MSDSWLHLSLRTAAADSDAIANFLIERGAPGVVVKPTGLEAYFARSRDDASLKRAVRRFVREVGKLRGRGATTQLQWQVIGEENWHDSWRRFIKPSRVGKTFWVTPPWLTPAKFRRRQVITIEPGLAFGTGTHATTRGCMEFLERAAASFGGREFTALDVGTGAGILAVALVKLGAKQVWAIDNDPVALNVARENLRANGAAHRVRLSGKKLTAIKKHFAVVVANLTAETILELAPSLEEKVATGGFLILSGIIRQMANAIAGRFRAKFRIVQHKRGREWATLLLRKK